MIGNDEFFVGFINMSQAMIYSLAICVAGVALEGLFAGRGIRRRLRELRLPRYAVPFWGWVVIGILYYAICFAIFYRLFRSPTMALRDIALGMLGAIMFINALWNLFFFRTRNLFHAYMTGLPYTALAVVLFVLLWRTDRVSAWYFFPYVLYLIYANIWGYGVWKLNSAR